MLTEQVSLIPYIIVRTLGKLDGLPSTPKFEIGV